MLKGAAAITGYNIATGHNIYNRMGGDGGMTVALITVGITVLLAIIIMV